LSLLSVIYGKSKPFLLGWLGLLLIYSCKTDEGVIVKNKAPSTKIAIDTISLPDSLRLFTQVKLHWSGFDSDGFITGYRIGWYKDSVTAFNKLSSSPIVKNTDSTFLFNFSGTSNLADINFFVQAIDDIGLSDPNPAYLRIPVKNSPPTIKFLTEGLSEADTIWSVASFPYAFSDPEGPQNLDSVFFRINDSKWVGLPKNINFISIVPTNPSSFSESDVVVYAGENLAGSNLEPSPIPNILISGLKLNDYNRFYIKVKDLAGAEGIDSIQNPYYFKRKTGDLLMIDAYKGPMLLSDTIYSNIVSRLTNFDKIDFFNSDKNQPKFWNATFYLICKLYKKVFWYSDVLTETPNQTQLLISSASNALSQYLRFNGKLLASIRFPNSNRLLIDDPLFSYIPVESYINLNLRRTSFAEPTQVDLPYPKLTILNPQSLKPPSSLILNVNMFKVKSGADSLYFIPKPSITTVHTGPGFPVACRTRNPNGKTNLIVFSMELAYFSGNYEALNNTFKIILDEEFNW
jgi:hypothetical protein